MQQCSNHADNLIGMQCPKDFSPGGRFPECVRQTYYILLCLLPLLAFNRYMRHTQTEHLPDDVFRALESLKTL